MVQVIGLGRWTKFLVAGGDPQIRAWEGKRRTRCGQKSGLPVRRGWLARVIAVDTSALMPIVLGETEADPYVAVLEAETEILVSTGTIAEALIVAGRRNVGEEMARLIDGLGLHVVAVTHAFARRVAEAYALWGKGIHPAGLNFGDCFSYALAKEYSCPLLFVGDDFSKTDVEGVL